MRVRVHLHVRIENPAQLNCLLVWGEKQALSIKLNKAKEPYKEVTRLRQSAPNADMLEENKAPLCVCVYVCGHVLAREFVLVLFVCVVYLLKVPIKLKMAKQP